MSRRRAAVLSALTALLTLGAGSAPALAQGAPFCQPGESPSFAPPLAALQGGLGDKMGAPTECAHVDPTSGDTVQQTTTGLAYIRAASGVATFTDGASHWALTPAGLTTWEGLALDPPGGLVPPGLTGPDGVPGVPGASGVPVSPPGGPGVPGGPGIPGVGAPPSVPGVPGIPIPRLGP